MSDGQHRRILGRLGRERGFGALCECGWSVGERAVARGGYRAESERGRTDEAQLGHATRSPGWWSLGRVNARTIAAFSLETTPIESSHRHESATERTEPLWIPPWLDRRECNRESLRKTREQKAARQPPGYGLSYLRRQLADEAYEPRAAQLAFESVPFLHRRSILDLTPAQWLEEFRSLRRRKLEWRVAFLQPRTPRALNHLEQTRVDQID